MSSVFELGFLSRAEELTLDRLPIVGRIPEWLTGDLVRNGPGTFNVGSEQYRHWFDGLSMLHKFSFRGGQVSYANKFLDTQSYRSAMERGRITYCRVCDRSLPLALQPRPVGLFAHGERQRQGERCQGGRASTWRWPRRRSRWSSISTR